MRWVRPWPWLLTCGGLVVVIVYIHLIRLFFQSPPEEGSPRGIVPARREIAEEESGVIGLAREGRYEEALCQADHVLRRGDLTDRERAAFLLLRGRLLNSSGCPDERVLREMIASRCSSLQRAEAFEELFRIRYARKDYEGAIRILRELIDSRVDDSEIRGSSLMEVEANYRHGAAMGISECYREMGNGREAHRWALRAKYVWPFDSFCGNAIEAAWGEVEQQLLVTAQLAGIPYEKERPPYRASYRRLYGPPFWECLLGIGVGSLCLFLGAWALWRRRGRSAPAGERLLTAVLVSPGALLPLWAVSSPEGVGGRWAGACSWALVPATLFALFCWSRWARVLWSGRQARKA